MSIDFPYSESAGWFGVHGAAIGLMFTLVFLLIGRFIGFRVYSRRSNPIQSLTNPNPSDGRWPLAWHPIFLGIAAIALFCGAVIAIPAFWTVKKFRDIDLSRVEGWSVYRLGEEDRILNESRVDFTERDKTQKSLNLLESCKGVYHQHDILFDGYLLQLRMSDSSSSNLSLKIYRKSLTTSRKTVIPQLGIFEAGEYECPELQQWVVENLDPLFQNR